MLSLKETIGHLEIEEALILLAGVCEALMRRRGLRGESGPAGVPSNIPGPPGKDADPAEVAELLKPDLIAAIKSEIRPAIVEELKSSGVIDADGKAILIPGPEGKPSTIPGPMGPAGRDSTVPGPRGEIGPAGRDSVVPGPRGESGVTLEEVSNLIREIIGTSGDEILKKFTAVKREVDAISKDKRYHRVHSVREEVCNRISQHF